MSAPSFASSQLTTRLTSPAPASRRRRHPLQRQAAAVLGAQPVLVVGMALVGQPPFELVELCSTESDPPHPLAVPR